VPPTYPLQGQTKACRRYSTKKLQQKLEQLNEAQEAVQAAQRRACARVCGVFDSSYAVWCRAVTPLAELDALCALAKASESSNWGEEEEEEEEEESLFKADAVN
jgi:DNA mismatch repair protein MSH6